ncbi:unannotated protein [freshwater metagenome]|uniref:Unannotated protein n=1 Tax=freshwater metagenome TaxID=449393 RepID=A0A6J7HWE3_9ZZZZ
MKYEVSTPIWVSSSRPTAETTGPTAISGLGPIFGTRAEASAAVIKMPPVIGSDATPAITGLISSTIWK